MSFKASPPGRTREAPWVEELRSARKDKLIGGEIFLYPQIDSTNQKSREYGNRGAREGVVVLADSQSAGKGRLGREWESPGGVNLYFSVLLRPPLPPAAAAQVPLLAGVAVATAVSRATGLEARIKWPNDVLIGGKKAAGILAEMEAEGAGIRFIVVGIGVNVNWRQKEMPPPLRKTATSLREEGKKEFSRSLVAGEIFEELEKEYILFLQEGFSERLREKWNGLSWVNQKRVTAVALDQKWEGRALGLDRDGALLLEDEQGKIHRFIAGDISLRL